MIPTRKGYPGRVNPLHLSIDSLQELIHSLIPNTRRQDVLTTAQANLAAAQDALTNSELHTPFAGVIADLTIKVGEQASPAAPAAVLADFSQWIVETDNLTEIEVVKVNEGQKASIVLDALPAVTLHGTVSTISPVFEEKRGDVTYTARIVLTDNNPLVRWGMTAKVTFDK